LTVDLESYCSISGQAYYPLYKSNKRCEREFISHTEGRWRVDSEACSNCEQNWWQKRCLCFSIKNKFNNVLDLLDL